MKRYATALEVVPRILVENVLGGAEGNEVLSRLWARHEQKDGGSCAVEVEVLRPASCSLPTTGYQAERDGTLAASIPWLPSHGL